MRTTTHVWVCFGIATFIAAMAFFYRAKPATAPSVKIALTGYMNDGTNRGIAEFEVVNNGDQTVRLHHGISVERPNSDGPAIRLPRSGPVTLRPGERKRFYDEFYAFPVSGAFHEVLPRSGLVRSRFRGTCRVTCDGPGQRLQEWLSQQKWAKNVPGFLGRQKIPAYRFASPWYED